MKSNDFKSILNLAPVTNKVFFLTFFRPLSPKLKRAFTIRAEQVGGSGTTGCSCNWSPHNIGLPFCHKSLPQWVFQISFTDERYIAKTASYRAIKAI